MKLPKHVFGCGNSWDKNHKKWSVLVQKPCQIIRDVSVYISFISCHDNTGLSLCFFSEWIAKLHNIQQSQSRKSKRWINMKTLLRKETELVHCKKQNKKKTFISVYLKDTFFYSGHERCSSHFLWLHYSSSIGHV